MGLACSQIRLLTLTARKADCEYGISIDSMQKMALSREQTQLSQEYNSKLKAKQISYYANGKYNKINYSYLMGYGNNYAAENSLRGIKNHQFVSYLQEPGEIDITADVDFKSIGKIVKNSKSDIVKYYGPIPQVLI